MPIKQSIFLATKKCPGRNWIDGSSSQIWIRNQNLEIFTDPEHWITGTHLMI
jgi:hypothetical protein